MNSFAIFFLIFYYALDRNEAERQYLFSLFLILFRTILASNQAKMWFFNFFNFFAIFLEFSITRRVGTKQNDNFYFLSFSAFSNLFWLEMKKKWYFFNFLNYLGIFFEFYIRRRVGTKQNDNFYFLPFSSSFNLWWLEMEPLWYFLNFFEFFCYFFGIFYYALGRNGTNR